MINLKSMTIGVWYEAYDETGMKSCCGTYRVGESLNLMADYLGKKVEDLDEFDWLFFGIDLKEEIIAAEKQNPLLRDAEIKIKGIFKTKAEAHEARAQELEEKKSIGQYLEWRNKTIYKV